MTTDGCQMYQLRIVGHLDDRWSGWFGEFTIDRSGDGTCTLTGPVTDQSQLHGVLARLRDIGATLLSLRAVESDGRSLSEASADPTRGRDGQPTGDC
jgi:hypothetical protein